MMLGRTLLELERSSLLDGIAMLDGIDLGGVKLSCRRMDGYCYSILDSDVREASQYRVIDGEKVVVAAQDSRVKFLAHIIIVCAASRCKNKRKILQSGNAWLKNIEIQKKQMRE
jgi:hypothetical protein